MNNTYCADESVARSVRATPCAIWSTVPILPDLAVRQETGNYSFLAEERIPDIVVFAEVVQDVNCDH